MSQSFVVKVYCKSDISHSGLSISYCNVVIYLFESKGKILLQTYNSINEIQGNIIGFK